MSELNLKNIPWSLDGRLVLVTGASRGIGKAIAQTLGQIGGTVVGTATSDEAAQQISQFLADLPQPGLGIKMNIGDFNSIQQGLEEIKTKFGKLPEILVNNAGITRDNLYLRMKASEWDEVIGVNLTGVYHLTQQCIKAMVRANFGRIINISSVVGLTGNPGQVNYSAAKAGVIGMTKSIAKEFGSRNITANVVAPGFIETDMTSKLSDQVKENLLKQIPLGKMGQAEDIAYAVAFLASPMANYISGETLSVNGGMY